MQLVWAILFLFSNMLQGSQAENNLSYSYVDSRIGFSLELPADWKEKVYVQETDDGTVFMYKSVAGNEDAELFNIFLISPIQYKVHEEHVGFFRKIGQRNGLVIAAFWPTGVQYDDTNIIQKPDSDRFFETFASVDSVLATFRFHPDYDADMYSRVVQESAPQDEAYLEEYQRILKAEAAAHN